ncbi:cytochrome bd oxidase small subunit, CydX/CbdX family [Lonepinella koalarum]|uniref:Membrane bound YbgT-like protein n=1 Tax=Lonepinella koalarum TaxID=53417 RepID=A0A4R1KX57_9PAST|nr:cytochrome bd oxidase small subunit, CydX/CbdX family [Lonepinella koalarum]TCK69864.1 membrane bound YbgT-like protein [Lonepinella koalarum]TFJ90527.1 cytochrome bd oxidase small subunit, CydX/CbdX family [Lonepinella koalarum]TYG35224.1 cytochrome bd oxidase small subunit, CydX/CbdX family [Lonepinella koalarum]
MVYVAWVVGVLFAVWLSVKIVIKLENKGSFDE